MRVLCNSFCSRFLVELEADREMRRDEEELRYAQNNLYIAHHSWCVCSGNSPVYSSSQTSIRRLVSGTQQDRYNEEDGENPPASQFNGLEGSGLARRT